METIPVPQSQKIKFTDPIDIGEWNMDTTVTKNVSHGLDQSKIRSIQVTIRNDDGTSVRDFNIITGGETSIHGIFISSVIVVLYRGTGGTFDSADFDVTDAPGLNRGWVVIGYVD